MSTRSWIRRTASVAVATISGATLVAGAATSPAAAAPTTNVTTASAVSDASAGVARALARSLQDRAWALQVNTALAAGDADPITLARQSATAGARAFRSAAEPANATILAAKGLPTTAGPVVTVRLAGRATPTGVARADVALVAVAPTDDDRVDAVLAYDVAGRQHRLDPQVAPAQPVMVVGLDEGRALDAGLAVLQRDLAARGLNAAISSPTLSATAADGFWATRVMTVRLNDDEEPWFKGDAEIYSLVTGVGMDGQPRVDIVQMPYLDNDGVDYRPGQILVDWSHFKYNAVDAVMMEEDDATNYRALAQAIASALLTVLGGATYAPMVDAILQAMPDSWWTDDPDYVDSWYLLTMQTNGQRVGARNNGVIDFQPYFVSAT